MRFNVFIFMQCLEGNEIEFMQNILLGKVLQVIVTMDAFLGILSLTWRATPAGLVHQLLTNSAFMICVICAKASRISSSSLVRSVTSCSRPRSSWTSSSRPLSLATSLANSYTSVSRPRSPWTSFVRTTILCSRPSTSAWSASIGSTATQQLSVPWHQPHWLHQRSPAHYAVESHVCQPRGPLDSSTVQSPDPCYA